VGAARFARISGLTALAVFLAAWLTWTQFFAGDRLRSLPWDDLTARVAPLTFERGTTRRLSGPRTLALYLRQHGFRGKAPRVDFRRSDVVVVATGPRSASGYDLRVVAVTEHRRSVRITLRERTPGLRGRVRPGLTFPFRLIAFPRTGKAVVARLEGRP